LSRSIANNLSQFIAELNATSQAEHILSFRLNALRQTLYNASVYQIDFSSDASALLLGTPNDIHDLNNIIQTQHALNQDSLDGVYQSAYQFVMMQNPCSIIADTESCQNFAQGALT
jgi:hypothetical protein